MNRVKFLSAAAILSLMFATPVFARAGSQETGPFASYYPNHDVHHPKLRNDIVRPSQDARRNQSEIVGSGITSDPITLV
jgi:hypothetical protein